MQRQQRGGGKQEALEGALSTHILQPRGAEQHDLLQFFKNQEHTIQDILSDSLKNKQGIKWFLTLQAKLKKYNPEGEVTAIAEPVFRSLNHRLTLESQMEQQIAEAFQKLFKNLEDFQGEGNGWVVD